MHGELYNPPRWNVTATLTVKIQENTAKFK